MSKKTCLKWSWNAGDVLGKTPEDVVEFHCCASGFSQMWVMFLHRPICRLNPRGSTEFNNSFVNFGVTLPSNEKLFYSFVFWRGKNPPLFQIFTKLTFCFCKHSVCLIVILRTRVSDKIRKPWERNMRRIKAFSKLDLILQNKSLVQHSAKPFRL